MPGERLAEIIAEQKTKESDIPKLLFGRVTNLSPLTIRLNDVQQPISSADIPIHLSSLVRTGTPGGEALNVGDRIIVERWNGGQLFYIKEKERYQTVRHCTCRCEECRG